MTISVTPSTSSQALFVRRRRWRRSWCIGHELAVAARSARRHALPAQPPLVPAVVARSPLIAVGGVTVGVMALVIVLGVMNGLQNDLRDKILVVNPHLRVLTYGEGPAARRLAHVLATVRRIAGRRGCRARSS